jgi:hypothetical protein
MDTERLTVQHHCEAVKRNVEQFGKPGLGKGIRDTATFFQPTLTRSIAAGEELLTDYGSDFCKSLIPRHAYSRSLR